jgi:hypothetical protein
MIAFLLPGSRTDTGGYIMQWPAPRQIIDPRASKSVVIILPPTFLISLEIEYIEQDVPDSMKKSSRDVEVDPGKSIMLRRQ